MENRKAGILGELLTDIDNKTFELEAWKQKAILVIKRIFGDGDEKIGLIENLHYDFSSWSLRDSSGGKSSDKTKETARKIIEAAQVELLLLHDDNMVIATLKEELTGNDFAAMIASAGSHDDSLQALSVFISNLPATTKDQLLAKIVLKALVK
jgi:hypothetical protein